MEAKETTLYAIFNGEKQYKVPVFQRPYRWQVEECKRLFEDVVALSKRPEGSTHFLGAVVYTSNAARMAGVDQMSIIDGQQRITTISLLLIALMRDPRLSVDALRLKNFYLVNSNEPPDSVLYPKLSLVDSDQEVYFRLIEERPLDPTTRSRVLDNFLYMSGLLKSVDDVDSFYRAITQLDLVYISLSQKVDNPQLVFESLNSTGLRLSQTDLIRNLLLMDLGAREQTRLFKSYWLRIESIFSNDQDRFDDYMACFLAVEAHSFPKKTLIYDQFKKYSLAESQAGREKEELLSKLLNFAEIYGRVSLGTEADPDLRLAFKRLASLDSAVLTPLLMSAYKSFQEGGLSRNDLIAAASYLESYLVRRTVCDLRSNSVGATVQVLLTEIDAQDYWNSFQTKLSDLRNTARFPSDEETRKSLESFRLYEARRMSYILERLENSYREKEPISIGDYSVEHVLPQNPGPDWDLGDSPGAFQTYLHVLGNLTITGYNAEMGNRPFLEKKRGDKGLDRSPLRLNDFFKTVEEWNEAQIFRRGAELSARFVDVWPAPSLVNQRDAEREERPSVIGRSITIEDLIKAGLLEAQSVLVWERKTLGRSYYATLDDQGRIRTDDGEVFDTPFAAASHLSGDRMVNGWRFWRVDDWATGQTLEEIRAVYLEGIGIEQEGSTGAA